MDIWREKKLCILLLFALWVSAYISLSSRWYFYCILLLFLCLCDGAGERERYCIRYMFPDRRVTIIRYEFIIRVILLYLFYMLLSPIYLLYTLRATVFCILFCPLFFSFIFYNVLRAHICCYYMSAWYFSPLYSTFSDGKVYI